MRKLCGSFLAAGLAVWLSGGAQAASLYHIEPDSTIIGFSVDMLGLFSTVGQFKRFEGTLRLDLDHPEGSQVEVEVDTRSLTMPWPTAEETAESSDYFDVQKYPQMRFVSHRVTPLDATHARLEGDLTIRGTTRPQTFTAVLERRHFDPKLKAEVADFVVGGRVHRVNFGMTSDTSFVPEEVEIRINAHVRLAEEISSQ